jgi:hypothetical protein
MNLIVAQRDCVGTPVMCGRYRLSQRKRIIEEHFESVSGEED